MRVRATIAIAVVAGMFVIIGAVPAPAQVRTIERLSPIPETDEKISFNAGSATLTDEAKAILDRQAKILFAFPDDKATLFGHADPHEAGSKQGAWDLGLARAIAARDYLIAKGVSPDRLRPDSVGSDFSLFADELAERWLATMRFVTTEIPTRRIR